jgi:hypothetical protein
MKRIPWDEAEPGHFEVDLVHHCGPSASGEYVHTLQMIDVTTGWSERVAVLGRSYRVMRAGFERCLERLPFPVLEIHPDNGSEFFPRRGPRGNHHLIRFFRDIIQDVDLSRSRPYQKNDNRNVEQKNSTLVRAYLGYDRLDTVEQTRLLNLLYDKMWLYYNFFQPVMHLTQKTVIPVEGRSARIKRRYKKIVLRMIKHRPPSTVCATPTPSPTKIVGNYKPCGTRPTPATCDARSMTYSTTSSPCPALHLASPKTSTRHSRCPYPYRKERTPW